MGKLYTGLFARLALTLAPLGLLAGTISGSIRTSIQMPELRYRFEDGLAPYCANGTAIAGKYAAADGAYQYLGPKGVVAPQYACI